MYIREQHYNLFVFQTGYFNLTILRFYLVFEFMLVAVSIQLAVYTIRTWTSTMVESANSLSSRSAPPEFLTKLTYLVWNHHKAVRKIDTVRAYTLGEYYFAEVDIVLPKDMLLHKAHDIGESLQNKLETLPEIERAFVHLDYDEYDQTIEHEGHQEY